MTRILKCPSFASRLDSVSNRPKRSPQSRPRRLFADSPLVQIGRLSVVPLTEEQWDWFLA